MYRKFRYLLLLALFVSFSSGAKAGGLSWDTLWVKPYSGPVVKTIPNWQFNNVYGFYKVDFVSMENDTNCWFCEFSDITGDTIRKICKINSEQIILEPKIMKDTNYIIGKDVRNVTRIFDIQTGNNSVFLPDTLFFIDYNIEKNSLIYSINQYNMYQEVTKTYKIYNLDSNKVTNSISYLHMNDDWNTLPDGKVLYSPKGNYILFLLTDTDNKDLNYPVIRNFVLNSEDLSVKLKIYDWFAIDYNKYFDSLLYRKACFSDDETKLALWDFNKKFIDIYDMNNNAKLNRIYTCESNEISLSSTYFQFDSTGKYLILEMIKPISQRLFYNIETGNIDYMTDIFPACTKRSLNTSNYYGRLGNNDSKSHLQDISLSVNNENNNNCNLLYGNNLLNIQSENETDISKICVFDIRGELIYKNENFISTPFSVNLNLSNGAYFIVLEINGKIEYHKIIVQ